MDNNISYTAKVNKVKYYNAIIKHHLWNYKEEQIYTTNLVSCLVIQWDIMWRISSQGWRNEKKGGQQGGVEEGDGGQRGGDLHGDITRECGPLVKARVAGSEGIKHHKY